MSDGYLSHVIFISLFPRKPRKTGVETYIFLAVAAQLFLLELETYSLSHSQTKQINVMVKSEQDLKVKVKISFIIGLHT